MHIASGDRRTILKVSVQSTLTPHRVPARVRSGAAETTPRGLATAGRERLPPAWDGEGDERRQNTAQAGAAAWRAMRMQMRGEWPPLGWRRNQGGLGKRASAVGRLWRRVSAGKFRRDVKHTQRGGVEVGEQLEQQAVHFFSFSFSIPDLNSPVTGHRFRLLSQPLTCNYFLRQNTRETYSLTYADHSHLHTHILCWAMSLWARTLLPPSKSVQTAASENRSSRYTPSLIVYKI